MKIGSEENITLPNSLYRDIEKDVANLFEEFGISSLPIDPFQIAKDMGYLLKKINMDSELYQVFTDKKIDGITIENLSTKIIAYKDNQKIGRQRFSVAHEIAHIRMGHKGESLLANKIANHYAAYLLVPEVLIRATKCKNSFDIESVFCVTRECAINCYNDYQHWKSILGYRDYERKILKQFGFKVDI